MITSKVELKEYIAADNAWYNPKGLKNKLITYVAAYPQRDFKRFLYFLRKQEYYINTANGSKFEGLMGLYYERRKNLLGAKLGIEIGPNCFGKGLQIWHGNVVVNASVRAGENCILHGGNCIGNNGKEDVSPRLGDNVDVGYGAVLIGDIHIADNCIIGAKALVNRSFEETGSVIAGIPAKKIG